MDTEKAIYGRRSVREHTPQRINEALIRHLIDAAVHAPNAMNQHTPEIRWVTHFRPA